MDQYKQEDLRLMKSCINLKELLLPKNNCNNVEERKNLAGLLKPKSDKMIITDASSGAWLMVKIMEERPSYPGFLGIMSTSFGDQYVDIDSFSNYEFNSFLKRADYFSKGTIFDFFTSVERKEHDRAIGIDWCVTTFLNPGSGEFEIFFQIAGASDRVRFYRQKNYLRKLVLVFENGYLIDARSKDGSVYCY